MCKEYTQEELRIIRQFRNHNPHICYYCGKSITNDDDLTVDHKIPRDRFGKTWYSNLAIACKKCNKEKGSMTDTEYIEFKQRFNEFKQTKNTKRIKKLITEIQDDEHKLKTNDMINQEHIIMEARNDSRVRSYIRPNYYIQHMDNLFRQIEA